MHPRRHALDAYLARRHTLGVTRRRRTPVAALPRLSRTAPGDRHPHGTGGGVGNPPLHVPPAAWARRLRLVRGWAQYPRAMLPGQRVPLRSDGPLGLSGTRHIARARPRCPAPAAARRLPSATGRRACTGTPVRVARGHRPAAQCTLGLDQDAVDLEDGLRTIRHTTWRPSRCLPRPRTTPQALWRSGPAPSVSHPEQPQLFGSEKGGRLTVCTVRATCVPRSRQIGWRGPTARPGPRLQDFRPAAPSRRWGAGIGRASRSHATGPRCPPPSDL